MQFLGYIFLGLVPGLFWMWFYLRKDRGNPEPWSLIAKVFLFGVAITVPAIALEFGADYFFNFSGGGGIASVVLGTFFIVAPIEEALKYVVVREFVLKNEAYNEPLDGVIYMIVAALGFATLENMLVVFAGGGSVVFLRAITATLMHVLASGIVGYHLGMGTVHPEKKKAYLLQGILVAVVLHGLYNIIVSLSSSMTITLILVGIVLLTMFFILSKGIAELKEYGARQ